MQRAGQNKQEERVISAQVYIYVLLFTCVLLLFKYMTGYGRSNQKQNIHRNMYLLDLYISFINIKVNKYLNDVTLPLCLVI